MYISIFTLLIEPRSGGSSIMVSLAYCWHRFLGLQGPTFWTKPPHRPIVRIHDKMLTQWINKYGERGSPCLNPRLHLKGKPRSPFLRTEENPELSRDLIHPYQLTPKSPPWSTLRRKVQSNVSKALAKSYLRKKDDQLFLEQAKMIS